MSIFKKKPKEIYEYIDPELDIDAQYVRLEEDTNKAPKAVKESKEGMFESIETLQYVRTKCQIITESQAYIDELKKESAAVDNYISDVRIIDSQSEKMSRKISGIAREILNIREKRERIKKSPSRLKHTHFAMFERYHDDFPKALVDLQNDEKYASVVKHDMNMLEAEKMSLKEDIDNFKYKRNNIRNIAVISLLAMLAVSIIFFATGQTSSDNGRVIFMIIMALAAFYVALIFVMLRRSMYSFKVSERKLKRAVTLLNKTKIKYVNSVNSINYRHEKYGVKNAYELGKIYEIYLEESNKNDKYMEQSEALDDAEGMFEDVINGLGLHDPGVWINQLDAIVDAQAMKELKTSLNRRKQNLREQMDYNMVRIDHSRDEIMDAVRKHPSLRKEIIEIVDSYDKE